MNRRVLHIPFTIGTDPTAQHDHVPRCVSGDETEGSAESGTRGVNFAPAVARRWRDVWPLIAQTDDGNQWVTDVCWLYYRRAGARVLWVGSVTTPGATADVYACGPCIAELDHMVRIQSHRRDRVAARAVQSATLTVPAHTFSPRDLPGTTC
ncbi:hypothetical protein [Streptomyces sp. AS58]|uniref:hypothetical protein n=1 Tax=Streptomyces sp. AS58 TaxID=1519489 RepID=UPI000A5BE02B|nr:hypothetical protein [Streptomyces sp. AS58]